MLLTHWQGLCNEWRCKLMTILIYERSSQLPKSSFTALIYYAFSNVGIVSRFGVIHSASMTGQLPQINIFIMYGSLVGGLFTCTKQQRHSDFGFQFPVQISKSSYYNHYTISKITTDITTCGLLSISFCAES